MEIRMLTFDDLTEEEKESVPNNGSGKDYANYLKITHNGEVIALHSDAMEPEDARFYRDLKWIGSLIEKVYEIAKNESRD